MRVALVLLVVLALIPRVDDWIACWRSPETMVGVDCLLVLERSADVPSGERVRTDLARFRTQDPDSIRPSLVETTVGGEETRQDFDGDGTPDVLSVGYYHMEPIFQDITSGMVYVESGSTGELLLGYATPTPVDTALWCGDVDGNGTQDILIDNCERTVVLGSRGPGR